MSVFIVNYILWNRLGNMLKGSTWDFPEMCIMPLWLPLASLTNANNFRIQYLYKSKRWCECFLDWVKWLSVGGKSNTFLKKVNYPFKYMPCLRIHRNPLNLSSDNTRVWSMLTRYCGMNRTLMMENPWSPKLTNHWLAMHDRSNAFQARGMHGSFMGSWPWQTGWWHKQPMMIIY